ncbi:MAG: pilin [Patescibacteria group bacterium]
MNKKYIILSIAFIIIFTPFAITHADIGPDCNTGELVDGGPLYNSKGEPVIVDGKPVLERVYKNPCDFDALMGLINRIINFLLFVIATPLAAIIFCYAGFLLLTSGGSSESKTKAKKIIKNLLIGYVIALAAWLIVHTILTTLGYKGESFLK